MVWIVLSGVFCIGARYGEGTTFVYVMDENGTMDYVSSQKKYWNGCVLLTEKG